MSAMSLNWYAQCRFRCGLVFKAHRLLYHSNLGSIVIKKREKEEEEEEAPRNVGHVLELVPPVPVRVPCVSFNSTHEINKEEKKKKSVPCGS